MNTQDALIIRSISLTCMVLSLIGVVYLLKKKMVHFPQVALLIIWAIVSVVYYAIAILGGGFGIELLSYDTVHSISLFLRLYGALSILALVVATAHLKRVGDE